MNKREAKCTLVFRHWLRGSALFGPGAAFELKQAGSSLPFSALAPHQEEALLAAKHREILYKAPDDSAGFKPFDLFYLKGAQAYVVIFFSQRFSVIDIDTFLAERARSPRKSITVDRAGEIALISVSLKSRTAAASTSTR
jgi:hypothetical protein